MSSGKQRPLNKERPYPRMEMNLSHHRGQNPDFGSTRDEIHQSGQRLSAADPGSPHAESEDRTARFLTYFHVWLPKRSDKPPPPAAPVAIAPRIHTTGHPASAPENPTADAASKDRSPASSRLAKTSHPRCSKPYAPQDPPALYCSSRPGKSRSSDRSRTPASAAQVHFCPAEKVEPIQSPYP
jgi:hypothetical protein